MKMLSYSVENASDAIYIFEAAGQMIYANNGACRALGFSKDELTSFTIFDIASELKPEAWPDRLRDSLALQEAGTKRVYESAHRKKDGTNMPIEISVTYAELEGTLYGFSFVRDITARKKTELQLRNYQEHLEDLVASRTQELQAAQNELVRKGRLAVLGQLTGVVSHELRNPLGTIRTALYFINEKLTSQPDSIMRALVRAERNVVRCDKIIDELLDYTRSRKLELATVQIDDWVMSVVRELEIDDDIEFLPQLQAHCEAQLDSDRFRRCLINCLSNACEAMLDNPPERQKLLIVVTSIVGDEIEIAIADSGPGISEEELQNVFEPLYSTKGFGVGLGLPIVDQIMKQHRGSAIIRSTVGEGTTIALRFPRDLAAHI
jgi:PAS domain S-box-containing protein